MKKRSLAVLVLGLAVGAVTLFASGAPGSSSKSGGTFRIGTSSRIDSLNPYVAFNQDAYSTFMYIYPVLIQYDAPMRSSCPTSRERGSPRRTARLDVHDGCQRDMVGRQPLTAADVVWTVNMDVKYKGTVAANAAGPTSTSSGRRRRTRRPLSFTTRRPHATALSIQDFAILPKHIWSKYTGDKGIGLKTFANDAPVVGGGPFILTEYRKNDIALFQRNPNWFYGHGAAHRRVRPPVLPRTRTRWSPR